MSKSMTETNGYRLTKADAPSRCPSWCMGERTHHADDIDKRETFASAEELARARHALRTHLADVGGEFLRSLHLDLAGPSRVVRQGGAEWGVGLKFEPGDEGPAFDWMEPVVQVIVRPLEGDISADMTSGEARAMAAHLLRAADMLDFDGR
jgi:hypothetical protein